MKMKYILPMMMLAAMPLAADAQNKSGLVLSNLDKTAKPADDFYQFATGGWQKNNPLPAAYSRYGSFDQLAENSNKRINSILDELKKVKLTEWLILVISGIELITSLKNIPMQSTIPENITAATAIVKIVIIIFKSFLIFVTVIP